MLNNLRAEMTRKHITAIDISELLQIHVNSARSKIQGTHKFYVDEAILIHEKYFSDLDIVTLFENKGWCRISKKFCRSKDNE